MQGPVGPTGADGAQGPQGLQGPIGPTGADGAQGPQGLQGPVGPTGADGAQGPQGLQGPAGPAGADGAQGPQGIQGPQGPQGPAGQDGAQGPQGPAGSQGPAGAQGPQGIPGAIGPQGPAGPAGPVGCSTLNYVVKSNGTSATCSQIFDNGLRVGINTASPSHRLHVKGADNNVLRVEGVGSFGSGARFNFGDASFVYIEEDTDDNLKLYSTGEIEYQSGGASFNWFMNTDASNTFNDPSLFATDLWGVVGTPGNSIWEVNSYAFVNVSRRETKTQITPVTGALAKLVMEDIDNIQPSFYKYKIEETDKPRKHMHLGVVLDESPSYVQGAQFTGIDVYSLATLSLAGVKILKDELSELKSAQGYTNEHRTIEDFGNTRLTEAQSWVSFDDVFASDLQGALPDVFLTPYSKVDGYHIVERTEQGFLVNVDASEFPVEFGWVAKARVPLKSGNDTNELIPNELMDQIRISAEEMESVRTKALTAKPAAVSLKSGDR